MIELGLGGIYSILSSLVLAGLFVAIGYLFVRPVVVSLYRQHPGFLFPRNSLRLKTFREEIRARGYRWLSKNLVQSRKSLLTYWSFIWVIPFGVVVIFSLAYLELPVVDLVQTGVIRHGWQAQLTVSSLSFIVLIFLLEQISRTEYREGVVQEFFASSRIMPVIYFTLASSGLIAYLYFYHTPEEVDPLFVDATFFIFAGTVLGIGYVYYRVARLIFFDPMDQMSVHQVQHGIDLQIREEDRQSISKSLLEDSLPNFVRIGTNRDGRVFMAQELGLDGYIADIDLKKLNQVCRSHDDLFDGTEGASLVLNLDLGVELQPGIDVVGVDGSNVNPVEVPQELADGLSEAVYCSDDRPWKSGNRLMERNLNQIGASTRDAISNLNPSGLEKYLEVYTDLLQYATSLNREVIEDYGITPSPISDLVDHIYREFYQIMEAAGKTGSSDLINTVRGEIFRLSLAYHRQGENYLFEKSIGLYASYYRILFSRPSVGYNLVSGLLNSMNNILTMLTAALGRTNTVEEVEQVSSDIESFYGTLEDILRLSVEEGDARTFNNVWKLGDDDFVMVRPESEIYEVRRKIRELEEEESTEDLETRLEFLERGQGLRDKYESQLEEIRDRSELERLENRLEMLERQQEKVEEFQDEFEETQFVAAAWAYKEVRRGNLQEAVFQEMYSDSIKRYNFDKLAEVYFQMLTEPRLDLFMWESEDSDVFEGVQMSQPAVFTWLQEFFCSMSFILLDPSEFEIDDLTESDNPLAQFGLERTEYPDLEEGINRISREDLEYFEIPDDVIDGFDERKELFLTLHHHMEDVLERREEDSIIEADLDSEKVENFKHNYIDEFSEQFTIRDIFSEFGWLEVEEYPEDFDVKASGYNQLFPKGALIEDPPTEYIHYLDQKARSHIRTILEAWLGEGVSETEIESHDELLDILAEVCEENEVKALIISGYRARQSLINDSRFDAEFGEPDNVIGGYETDSGTVPVYKDSSSDFSVLVLYDVVQPPQITEYQRDGFIVNVQITETTRDLLRDQFEDFEEMDEEGIREKLQAVWLRIFYYGTIEVKEEFGTKIIIK